MALQYKTAADALAALARTQPNAPALHVPGRISLTYEELGQHAHYVQQNLENWGFTRGNVIVGVIPSRPEMAIACMLLPSSSTFAPMGSDLTLEEYVQLLVRMRAAAVVMPKGTNHCVSKAAKEVGIAEIELVSDPRAPAGLFQLELTGKGKSRQRTPTAPPEIDYILTSSGTTGRPKLVPSTHRQTLLYAKAAGEWLKYSPKDIACHLMPIHSGNGLRSSLINPLLSGMSVLCLPEGDVKAFFGALEKYRPTCLNAGFSVHRAILRNLSEHREAVKQSRFRFLRSGSGALRHEEIEGLEQGFEAPVLVSLSSVEAPISHDPLPPRRRKPGAAGLEFINEVATIDTAGQISQESSRGEIVVRGPLVFRGYLDDAELTSASFVGDWFRTGDLGHVDEEGYVHLSGRLKEIINRGGEKISPAEIDAVIESHAQIREAASFGISHPTLGEEVIAAAVRQPHGTIEEPQLLEYVGQRMMPARVPRRIYFVDRLPRNTNGKVLRHELPKLLDGSKKESALAPPANEAPLTALETAIAGIWTSLLPVRNVKADDNFFLIGGDSLYGLQLVIELKRFFGIDLPIRSLFGEATTLRGMAQTIEMLRKQSSEAPTAVSPTSNRVVTFNRDGSKPPFFFLHGGYAAGLKIAQHLGAEQPFHLLLPPGLCGEPVPSTIETLASYHAQTLLAVQPHGPYRLGGFCSGGIIAFEMAQQLQRRGEKVELLVVIDAFLRNTRLSFADRVLLRVVRLLNLDSERQLDVFVRWLGFIQAFSDLSGFQRIKFLLGKLTYRSSVSVSGSTREHESNRLRDVEQESAHYRRMLTGYIPHEYHGCVAVLRCEWGRYAPDELIDAWRKLVPKAQMYSIPGDHLTCLSDHNEALSERLKAWLDENSTPAKLMVR